MKSTIIAQQKAFKEKIMRIVLDEIMSAVDSDCEVKKMELHDNNGVESKSIFLVGKNGISVSIMTTSPTKEKK